MLVNNIISKAKWKSWEINSQNAKIQKVFFYEYVYYIKDQQDITTINKKNTTNWHLYSTTRTFSSYRQNWKTLFYFIVYMYINIKPNIHFNLQHDISDPTFCASDPKPPKIKKPFNVFNFQNYYFTLTRVWRRSKEVKGQKDEVDHH